MPCLDSKTFQWPSREQCDPGKPAAEWSLPEGWQLLERVEHTFCFMSRHTATPSWHTDSGMLLYRVAPFAHGAMRAAYYFYDP
eukprot:5970725-Amphidinium_carterae.1